MIVEKYKEQQFYNAVNNPDGNRRPDITITDSHDRKTAQGRLLTPTFPADL